jgi:hypothetical protein
VNSAEVVVWLRDTFAIDASRLLKDIDAEGDAAS